MRALRRLALAAVAAWVGRWALRWLASAAGNTLLPRGPAPVDSPRQPGRMPGPFDL
jgi:hypothetical protein